ncbi:MAG: hypothetical protein JWR09_4731 [Mucilaginibacter sp.]|nr:hypothetical protein [Mucilaginibacter sp.]
MANSYYKFGVLQKKKTMKMEITLKPAVNWLTAVLLLLPFWGISQSIEKRSFNPADNAAYYLAVRPQGPIRGILVLFNIYQPAEAIPPETKLHNVAYANNLLTIYASLPHSLAADSSAINQINAILKDVVSNFQADTSRFVLAGFGFAGNVVLRYTELTGEHPGQYPVKPKAVFTIASFVDLQGLCHWCEREIKKNYDGGNVGDAKFILNYLTKPEGNIAAASARLKKMTPFDRDADTTGNEKFLTGLPVRLYYDGDITWDLTKRHNSVYDTELADGSELISRLLQAGNKDAELVLSKQPGYRSNGLRNSSALSIVDETDCIRWIFNKLNIFNPGNPQAWKAPYVFPMPERWTMERTSFPPSYSPNVPYKGFEDIHFPPGWGDSKTDDYWTVSYLFRLNGKHNMDAATLQDFLKVYYEGLVADNVPRRHIPKEKLVPINASLKKIKTDKGDLETYSGVISSLDYLAQVPIKLNCRIHLKPGGENFTPLLIEVSPKPYEHPIWQKMEQTVEQFQCGTGKAE